MKCPRQDFRLGKMRRKQIKDT